MTLIVCPLSLVPDVVARRAPSHLVTLLDPSHIVDTPQGLSADRHLRCGVNDIIEHKDGYICPDPALVERILAFAEDWDATQPMVVHCWAGISRSTATAYTIACARNPDVGELQIARTLRLASRHAHPNARIVAIADDILGRRGRMVDAVAAIGPGDLVEENHPFDLPARY